MKMYSKKVITTNQQKEITGGQYLVNLLESRNVDTIFGYPGAPILPIYNALSNTDRIKHILTRHEQGAIHAAEGYARTKNKCGVVLVTSGPGITNTITGLMNAYSDKTPLVVIAGHSETTGNNEFQDVNISKLTECCTKKTYIINNIDDLEKTVKNAFLKAEQFPKGPCVIGITKSVLESLIDKEQTRYKIKQDIKVEAPHSCVLKALESLKNAKKPLIIAGGGCRYAEQELAEFIHLTHIPVVTTLMAAGAADNYTSGMIGSNGDNYLNQIINNADIVLALGTRFSKRTTNNSKKFLPFSKIININIERNTSDNVSTDKEITGEIDIILRQMIEAIKSKNILFDIPYDWIETLSIRNEQTVKDTECLTSEYVLNEIYNYTKKYRPVITTDVGEHQIDAVRLFKSHSCTNFITSGGAGTMGFGLPAAIGAYIAKPNSLVLNITGDGSFQMNMQELGTCAEYNIPVKIFIMNNSALGMVKTLQEQIYNSSYQSEMINPDYIKIAGAYGILGYKIKTKPELKKALKEIFKYKKAVLLDIDINSQF